MNRARGRGEAGILAIEQIFQIHKISHEGCPRLFPSQGPKLLCISETTGDPRSWRLELVTLSHNINITLTNIEQVEDETQRANAS